MIELFQITGSCSFAVRAALEEAGAAYRVVDVHPVRRDQAPGFGEVNPLMRVPALREGGETVYETGAVLLWVADRFPEAALAPAPGTPGRGAHYRWNMWLADTLHPAWWPVMLPGAVTADESGWDGVRSRGVELLARHGEHLEAELADREWCLGERFSVADIYLYMLVGWSSGVEGVILGGDAVASHHARVGARPAVARTRALDDLDDRLLRVNPGMRGGKPVSVPEDHGREFREGASPAGARPGAGPS